LKRYGTRREGKNTDTFFRKTNSNYHFKGTIVYLIQFDHMVIKRCSIYSTVSRELRCANLQTYTS